MASIGDNLGGKNLRENEIVIWMFFDFCILSLAFPINDNSYNHEGQRSKL